METLNVNRRYVLHAGSSKDPNPYTHVVLMFIKAKPCKAVAEFGYINERYRNLKTFGISDASVQIELIAYSYLFQLYKMTFPEVKNQ